MSVHQYTEGGDAFSTVSKRYDILNQVLSFGLDMYWRKRLLRMMLPYINRGDVMLDLATGTFDVAKALVQRVDATVLAVDYSLQMLIQGTDKIQEHANIVPIQADGRSIPLHDASIDIITISFGIRNITPRSLVFREWYRLLKQNKRFYILEFCNPQEIKPYFKRIYLPYLFKVIPTVASLFGADKAMYEYLAHSIDSFPRCTQIQSELIDAGFTDVHYAQYSFGTVAVYTGVKR